MILDLRDKISQDAAFESAFGGDEKAGNKVSAAANNARDEAVEALEALGYSASDAYRAVKMVTVTEDMDANDILKAALKQMAR